ncbi:MAG TPA: MFS transporter, partial [Terriglobales bacterium]|nr:MFS transporter [Terriglobales bacterium]
MALHRTEPPAIDRSAMTATAAEAEALLAAGTPRVSTPFFALAVGLLALNLTSAQPLIGVIAPAIHLAPSAYGLISMLMLLGYAAGLILLVPLTDLFENRRLILGMFTSNVAALVLAALAQQSWLFLAAMFINGMTTSVIQMLVPLAASLTEPAHRGRVVGNIMGGVMLGILLSRPLATVAAEHFGWRLVFGGTAVLIAALTVSLFLKLPQHRPLTTPRYLDLVISLWTFLRTEPVLQLRATTAGLCFASFSFFWTVITLRLTEAPFHLGADGIALFALAGAGGTIIAPVAGRLGDRGLTKGATVLMHLAVILAIASAWVVGAASFARDFFAAHEGIAIGVMMIAALILDIGVIGDQTLGRRAINMIRPEARGRLNGLFTGGFFIGGAIGSMLAGAAWAWGGWQATSLGALIAALLALALSLRSWLRR